MKVTVETKGFKELEASLTNLGAQTGQRILRSSVRAAAKPMIEKAKANVPYNTPDENGYHLRDMIRLQAVPKKLRKATVEFFLGAARVTSTKGRRKIIGGLGFSSKSPNYARIIEKTTPWLRPAFDTEYKGFISGLRAILKKKIESAVKRQAKKIAKRAANK